VSTDAKKKPKAKDSIITPPVRTAKPKKSKFDRDKCEDDNGEGYWTWTDCGGNANDNKAWTVIVNGQPVDPTAGGGSPNLGGKGEGTVTVCAGPAGTAKGTASVDVWCQPADGVKVCTDSIRGFGPNFNPNAPGVFQILHLNPGDGCKDVAIQPGYMCRSMHPYNPNQDKLVAKADVADEWMPADLVETAAEPAVCVINAAVLDEATGLCMCPDNGYEIPGDLSFTMTCGSSNDESLYPVGYWDDLYGDDDDDPAASPSPSASAPPTPSASSYL
jgi:hypothetical protein